MSKYCFALLPFLLLAISPQQQPVATPAVAAAPAVATSTTVATAAAPTIAPAKPAEAAIPAEFVHMVNPVRPTRESQAHAKLMYSLDCTMCHGEKGDGKGDAGVISDMKLTMMDFTNPATLKSRSDGEVFYIIKNGQGKMPGETDRGKTDELWNLVIYVRSFAKK